MPNIHSPTRYYISAYIHRSLHARLTSICRIRGWDATTLINIFLMDAVNEYEDLRDGSLVTSKK